MRHRADANAKALAENLPKACAECGRPFRAEFRCHTARRKYCSVACVARLNAKIKIGSGNPNWKPYPRCLECGAEYRPRNPGRKYCSRRCAGAVWSRRFLIEPRNGMRNLRTDANQQEIVEALRKVGAAVLVTPKVCKGFPDLIVGFGGTNFLVEVKNPKTRYGQKGLSENQKRWSALWPSPVFCVKSVAEALAVIGVGVVA